LHRNNQSGPLILLAALHVAPTAISPIIFKKRNTNEMRHNYHRHMKPRFWIGIILLLFIGTGGAHIALKKANHNRCAREAEAHVARFLRNGGAFTNKGPFQYLEGEGYTYPVWNIQGYEFLDLRRSAYFSNGVQDIRIILREGSTPDGKIGPATVEPSGNSIQPATIYVTHPRFRP
jgi:hypothetical protein